jgi:protocatechuate 3,4-dioxygenase beta subunit
MNVVVGVPENWFTTETDANGKFSFKNIPAHTTSDFLIQAPGFGFVYTSSLPDGLPGWRFSAGRTDIRVVLPPEAKIRGRVVDPNGNGVGGVRLLARPISKMGGSFCPDSTLSGEDGCFCFRGMPAETYSLQVVSSREGLGDWVGKDVKVVVKPGQTIDSLRMEVEKGAVLDFVVREARTNRPIRDAWVSASQVSRFGRDIGLLGFYKRSRTDSNGVLRIGVPQGECRIYASGEGYSTHLESYAVEAKNSPLKILLDPEPSISGVVYDQTGEPVARAMVDVLPHSYGAVQTDSAGRFNISWYGAFSVPRMYVFARHAKHDLATIVEIKEQSTPLKIKPEHAVTLSGRVADPDGAPIAAARVKLWAALGRQRFVVAEVTTNALGHYKIKAVPLEQEGFNYHSVEVASSGYGPFMLTQLSLTDAINNRIELEPIVLSPANLSISGTVVDASDNPVADVRVFLAGPGGNRVGQHTKHTLTDVKGEFSFARICAGPLRLQASMAGSESGFLDAKGTDRNVRIVLGRRLVHRKQVSLVGKPLPALNTLNISGSPAPAQNQRVLMCFWDMEQRPSRNCIIQLAKQAEQLKQKDVTIVAIQASKVDENILNEWIEKNDIPLPFGMIQGDEEKIRFAWGAKSLPWLILTDNKHIVRAEGFALSELSEKLKQMDIE